MSAMEHSRIKRIVLKKEDYEIEIERECAASSQTVTYTTPQVVQGGLPPSAFVETKAMSAPTSADKSEEKQGALYVTSPMVGTYYASPSPDDPPFAKLGDSITEESVVCIIEAMKVMNEVKANVRGTISEILIKNGEPVEFGTQIIRVNPA